MDFNDIIPLINGTGTLTAAFAPKVYYTVSVFSDDTNKGTVSGGGTVVAGGSVYVSATPKSGYAFEGWYLYVSTKISGSASFYYQPSSNCTLSARFVAQYTVTAQSEDTNKGTVSGGGTVAAGSTVVVAAIPKPGYLFEGWYLNSVKISGVQNFTHIPSASCTLTAKFVAQYTVSVQSEDTNKGTVSGGGSVVAGGSVTVSATPKSGYAFEGWYLNGTKIPGSASFNYYPSVNCSLIAKFTASPIISGPSTVCYDGSAFTLGNAPSGFTWSVNGPFSLDSITANPVIVYRTGTGVGIGTLMAIAGDSVIAITSITPCPPSSISGPSAVCYDGGDFTLNNDPPGFTWSVSGPFSLNSTTANPVTVTRRGSNMAEGTLMAYINGRLIVSKTITPCASPVSGPDVVCYDGGIFTLDPVPPPGSTVMLGFSGPFTGAFVPGNPAAVEVFRIGSSNSSEIMTVYSNGTVFGERNLRPCSAPVISGDTDLHLGSTYTFSVTNTPAGYTWGSSSNLTPVSGSPGVYRATGMGSGYVRIMYNGIEISKRNVVVAVPDYLHILGPDIINLYEVYSTSNHQVATWSVYGSFSLSSTTGSSVSVTPYPNMPHIETGAVMARINGQTVIKFIRTGGIVGPDYICSNSSASYSLSTGESASWSVPSGFSISGSSSGRSVTVTANGSNQSGMLTATVFGDTYTQYIASRPTPDCHFPVAKSVYLLDLDCGASVALNPSPHDVTALYKWELAWAEGVEYGPETGTTEHLATIHFAPGGGGGAMVNAYLYDPVHGYAPHATFEYRLSTGNCTSYSSSVIAYPNPTSNMLTVDLETMAGSSSKATKSTVSSTRDIRLYDGQGNLLRQQKAGGGTVQFNISQLRAGVYYLHVYDGVSDKPKVQKIIVER